MRFCKYCGAEVSGTDRICPVCNKEIGPSKNSRENPDSAVERAAVISVPGSSLTAGSTPDKKTDSTPGTAPEKTSGMTPGTAPEKTPEKTPGTTSGKTSGMTPGTTSGKTSGMTPGKTSETTSGKTLESSPEIVQNKTLKSGKGFSKSRNNIYLPVAAVAVSVVLAALLIVFTGRCKAEGCSNRKASGSDYCYYHKCDAPGCRKERMSYSNYCYEHYSMYDDDAQEEEPVYSWELQISDVKVYSEYSFTYAEGTLTNNSDATVKYVKVKGSFKSRLGTVIDTDWTYAVGGEGLAPGESCKWKMTVTKDLSIEDCDVTILDYD